MASLYIEPETRSIEEILDGYRSARIAVRPSAVTQRPVHEVKSFGSPPARASRRFCKVAAAKWTPEEDDILRALLLKEYSSSIIADHISGRTGPSVRSRAARLGLNTRPTVCKACGTVQPAAKFKAPETQRVAARFIRIKTIVSACANAYDVDYADIISARRTAEVMRPRQVSYYLARMMTHRTLPEIGRAMGGRDHTTVLSGFRKIEHLVKTDESLAEEIRIIRASLELPPVAAAFGTEARAS